MPPEAAWSHRPRLVLAFDLDNMYVACERLRNPALVGKPVGVQQKGLLATASYEARALGVDKLCSLRDAKKRCPSLILVNGEDLTLYRYYSRQVFNLVRTTLSPSPVEKLGLDELFCDVTDLVAQHLEEVAAISPDPRGRWFALASGDDTAHPESKGFWYDPSAGCPGYTIPEDSKCGNDHAKAEHLAAMIAGSHLANHIRHLILQRIGLGSSAGIAYSKTLAKLVGNLHKPAQQTTLVVHPSQGEVYASVVRDLLDPLHARKLMGFGSKVLHTLHNHINSSQKSLSADTPDNGPTFEGPLTVGFLRRNMSESVFRTLLGAQQGQRLWDLLDGKDDEPVKSSPDFPLTISVEDSFDERRGTLDWPGVLREIEILANSLLRRLEIELVDGGRLEDLKSDAPSSAPGRKWQRYPSQVRLTIRTGHSRDIPYNANRESRSAALPVSVFDLAVPRADRARALVRHPLTSLAKQIVDKGSEPPEKYEISIINIAVTHLQTTTPTKAIQAFFASAAPDSSRSRGEGSVNVLLSKFSSSPFSGKRRRPTWPADLDLNTLRELPANIRDELLREYGLDPDDLKSELDGPPTKRTELDASLVNEASDPSLPVASTIPTAKETPQEDQDSDSSDDAESSETPCAICGIGVFAWSMDAHMAFHSGS